MTARILEGPPDNNQLPKRSLGIIFYNALKEGDPSRTILVDSTNEEVNNAKFLQLSVTLAKKLKDLGVTRGDVITIISQNQWKFLATVIAGFYIGATVNLLNPDYTAGELKGFLAISRPVLIFCTTNSLKNLDVLQDEEFIPSNLILYDGEATLQVKNFDRLLEGVNDDEIFNPVELDPKEDVALIVASSGTSGLPKCVQLTHSNFRLTMMNSGASNFLDINSKESIIGYLPFYHVSGIFMSLATILYGAKTVILEKFIPDVFLHTIEEHRITKMLAVPTILSFLAKSPLVQNYDLSSIKDIIAGGATIKKEIEEMIIKQLNVKAVRQIYGMTESSGAVTQVPKNSKKRGSLGVVLTACQIKVCNIETGKMLPANEIGELRIKGDGVMKGYAGNDTETKEAFDEDGFLKSGDLGYYDDDGYFYVVDRLKDIIKYKAFQVSPAELENLLNQHPSVKDAGVVGQPDERAGEVPVAFVVKQPNEEITEEELINYVSENISKQKHLYGGVRFVDEIPKSSIGKILRRKLRELL